MEIRQVTRTVLATVPVVTVSVSFGYMLYLLSATPVPPNAGAAEIGVIKEMVQTYKEITLFIGGIIGGSAATAGAFYFKADRDE